MNFSTKGRYGLRAMIDLAVHSEEAVPISSIAARENISECYLEQLAAKLKKAGLVVSTRGAQGGYRLARPSSEISVGDVLRALEGSVNAVECPGLLEEESCQNSECCAARSVWQKINDSITKAVDDIDLAQLAEESRRARAQFAEAKVAEKAADPCKGVQ